MSEAEIDFLRRVRDGRRLKLADRVEDRLRQKLRRAGYVEVKINPRRWALTEAGQRYLKDPHQ